VRDGDLDLDLLLSPSGERLLDAARATRDLAALVRPRALAHLGAPEAVRAALGQDDLRRRAAAKTPHAERMLFTREALEQASAWPVALDRARRLGLGLGARVADLGAGVGFDALAAAEAGLDVVAVEQDPQRARLLAHNARVLGLDARVTVLVADLLEAAPPADAALLDPDRRTEGRRSRDPSAYAPPLASWDAVLARYAKAVVKLPPAGDDAGGDRPQEVVSLDGEARERRVLWRGFPEAPARCARALPGGATLSGSGLAWPDARRPEPGDRLLDPDVSVTLSNLVGEACRAYDLAPVHARIAYLVGRPGSPAPSAPGRWFEVLERLPPEPRALDAWLRAHDVGRLELKSRGVAEDAGRWRARLHPKGTGEATLLFTRDPDDTWVVLAARALR
jgi:hypothetical protein